MDQQEQIDVLEAPLATLESGDGAHSPLIWLPTGWLLLGGLRIVVGVVVQSLSYTTPSG